MTQVRGASTTRRQAWADSSTRTLPGAPRTSLHLTSAPVPKVSATRALSSSSACANAATLSRVTPGGRPPGAAGALGVRQAWTATSPTPRHLASDAAHLSASGEPLVALTPTTTLFTVLSFLTALCVPTALTGRQRLAVCSCVPPVGRWTFDKGSAMDSNDCRSALMPKNKAMNPPTIMTPAPR